MLDLRSALTLLEDAWDELRAEVQALRTEWDPESVPVTVLFSDIAHALAASLPDIQDEPRQRVFQLIEDLILCGNHDVVEGIKTGFLEALLSDASAGQIEFREIAPLLGPRTTEFCRAWDEFTGIRTPGLWLT